ncbi:ABC transporter substrate-binding protein [Streptomyces winkii]|uniref:ABC transporter substrate-binding protein n=1 Tax=Streptomyces winkii TaxID=3051178 RepID=UPI0028D00002|nr:ABC transporter substrate-binding protein [Streptomyces sp. DSM 40971]
MKSITSRGLALATAALATVSLAACTSGDSEASEKPEKIEKIGLMVQDMSNPFFSAMDKGAKRAASKIGASNSTQDAQLDLDNQNKQIETFIQQGVDLIVISAVDGKGIQPAIERAQRSGIIVVAVDTPAKGADAVVMTDAVQAGEKSCEYLFEQLGGKGSILIVDGTPIQTIRDRITGCERAMKKHPGIKVAGHQSSKNDRSSGLAVTTDMLTAAPKVQGIFGMNDPSALGAVQAVTQANKTDQVQVTGVDGSPEGVDELKRKGSPFVGTATQNPGEMVRRAVQVAQGIVDGKPPKQKTILIPSKLVTRDNVEQYKGW